MLLVSPCPLCCRRSSADEEAVTLQARYLFRAACSELATEIQRNRKVETERMRTDRAQLQQEVDVLGQRLSQELLALKDDLRGMFNDRKMEVRMEQRSADSSVCVFLFAIQGGLMCFRRAVPLLERAGR